MGPNPTEPAPISVLKCGSLVVYRREKDARKPNIGPGPIFSIYICAQGSRNKRKYVGHLITFFDFVDGGTEKQPNVRRRKTTEEIKESSTKSLRFVERARKDNNWAFYRILDFLQFQKERIERKEIVAGTLKNYSKAIRLFCEMSEIEIPWRRITRGLPRPKRYASDRVPTIEEVKKLVAYPDRRIKAIVYTMISSGIRLEAWDYIRWAHIRANGGRREKS